MVAALIAYHYNRLTFYWTKTLHLATVKNSF